MKRALAILVMVFAANAIADTWTDPSTGYTWTYRIVDGSAEIYKGEWLAAISPNPTGTLTIPDALDGVPVMIIGNSAFQDCSDLTGVMMPDGVTIIDDWAFSGCSGLASMTIPDKATSIGDGAFYGCSGLTNVTIPDSVTNIGNYVFSYCSGLKNVKLGEGVTIIKDSVFSSCNNLTSVTIPDSVTNIEYGAFYDCSDLASMTIPGHITCIGERAFYNCNGLTRVTMIGNCPSIGIYAFSGVASDCVVYLPQGNETYDVVDGKWQGMTVEYWGGDLTIENGVLKACSLNGATKVIIPDNVTSIREFVFNNCSDLTSITLPEGLTTIKDFAFCDCSGLTSINIPDSVTSIGGYAFDRCPDAIFDFTTKPGLKLLDGWVVGYTDEPSCDLDLTGVRGIMAYAFSGCSGLTSVTIPDSAKEIGYCAFASCFELMSVMIGDGVTSIEESAFSNCRALKNVTIGNSVTSIGDWAFSGCWDLTSITIPNSVTNIGFEAFGSCDSMTSVIIGDGVTRIEDGAFIGCDSMTSITIPNSVTSIGDRAFAGCENVRNATVPGWQCGVPFSNVTNLVISPGTTSINACAFWFCTNMLSVVIGNKVANIWDRAFYGCSGLTSVTIPDSVTSIGDEAFCETFGMASVMMMGDCPAIRYHAFNYGATDCKVYLPRGNETYDVVDGKWQEMTVEYYDVVKLEIGNDKGEVAAVEGGYVVTAKEDATLTEDDFTFGGVAKEAYKVEIALDGKSATVALNPPQVGVLPEHEDEAPKDEDDISGLLVEVEESMISERPETKEGQEVGALPVKTYPGLYYRAAWGDDLGGMTEGNKVQATGDSLYLGVIKQKGPKGFYRLTVSEQ